MSDTRLQLDEASRRTGGVTITSLVEALCSSADGLVRPSPDKTHPHLPSREAVARSVQEFRTVLFPGYFGTTSELSAEALHFHVGATLERLQRTMVEQVRRAFCFSCESREPNTCRECESRAATLTDAFLQRLPEVRRLLATDVIGAYEGDPGSDEPGGNHPVLPRRPGPDVPADRARTLRARRAVAAPHPHRACARRDRHRYPSWRDDRREVLHRSRHRRGDRRDSGAGPWRAALPGSDARREELPARRTRTSGERRGLATRFSKTT